MARSTARDTHLSASNPANSSSIVLSGRSNTATLNFSAPGVQVTAFGEEYHSRIGDGIKDFEFSIGGYYDGAASQLGDFMFNSVGACVNFVYGPQGSATGQTKYSGCVILDEFEISGELEGAVEWSATMTAASVLSSSTF